MKQIIKSISLIGLILLMGSVAYLETEFFNFDEKVSRPVSSDFKTDEELPSLENILDDSREANGYLVETYQEYEVYRNKNGIITKTVPTGNFSSIRYKIDQK
ncbi:hypothetical protein D0469_07685 [Peribacillus saganii]|uniref:Uncharacterized protein n=1 Tax=Peribacillus saganii TaxID=2303992 RepID=A0A372LQF5_9BACI|nr:hypothetical protein [Peribacillus saganii]RFU70058.1 hypothetical protein D0469_07685 [Peribacillus saganii]